MVRETQREVVRRLWKQGKSETEIAGRTRLDTLTISHMIAGFKASKTRKRQKRTRRDAAFGAHDTRRRKWYGMKKKLLVLDCTPAKEGMSEGSLVNELIDILNAKEHGPVVQKDFFSVLDRESFISNLEKSDHGVIHISAHGTNTGKGPIISLPLGARIKVSELTALRSGGSRSKKSRLIFLSACETGQEELSKAFFERGYEYFIAPAKEVYWYDAAIFLTLFYRLLLVEKNKSPWVAFRTTKRALKNTFPRLSGNWRYFEKGEEWVDD